MLLGLVAPSLFMFASLTSLHQAVPGHTPKESVIYSFLGGSDGRMPMAGVIAGAGGVLYGTTTYGGGSSACFSGCGTVFALTPAGSGYSETILYRFQGKTDGALPFAGLAADANGVLYGTTLDGGHAEKKYCSKGCGTVFALIPSQSGYQESVLYRFLGGKDGNAPSSPVIIDSSGALYGTTQFGGKTTPLCSTGCGTVFELTPAGSTFVKSVVYRFRGGSDGAGPGSGLLEYQGALFGTTSGGGDAGGDGTAFELTPTASGYREHVIYRFGDGSGDAAGPNSALIADGAGNLYGTSSRGGGTACSGAGCGTVFLLSPNGSEYTDRVLHSFGVEPIDGIFPVGGVVAGDGGKLYGVTEVGNAPSCHACGTVYELLPHNNKYTEKILHGFAGSDPSLPSSGLTLVAKKLFGTGQDGGDDNLGGVFSLSI